MNTIRTVAGIVMTINYRRVLHAVFIWLPAGMILEHFREDRIEPLIEPFIAELWLHLGPVFRFCCVDVF